VYILPKKSDSKRLFIANICGIGKQLTSPKQFVAPRANHTKWELSVYVAEKKRFQVTHYPYMNILYTIVYVIEAILVNDILAILVDYCYV
jgi:hypothetical protein